MTLWRPKPKRPGRTFSAIHGALAVDLLTCRPSTKNVTDGMLRPRTRARNAVLTQPLGPRSTARPDTIVSGSTPLSGGVGVEFGGVAGGFTGGVPGGGTVNVCGFSSQTVFLSTPGAL